MKKYVLKGVVVFIIICFIFGCMSLKTHIGVNDNFKNNALTYTKDYKIGAENFVFLLKEVVPLICLEEECEPKIDSTASGFVFSSDENSIFVMTAAHFCAESESLDIFLSQNIIGFANDTPRQLYLLYMDKEKDLCMLHGVKNLNENFGNIKIAKEPTIGERVYTVAAPEGIAGPGIRLIFDGIFSGCDELYCMSTIPATFGSSGAGIYNKKGELISVVMAVPQSFSHVVISPSHKDLIKFIKIIDDKVDIYPYR